MSKEKFNFMRDMTCMICHYKVKNEVYDLKCPECGLDGGLLPIGDIEKVPIKKNENSKNV